VIRKGLTTRFLTAAFVAVLSGRAVAQPPATPDGAAKQWLLFIDGGDYAKGWDRAGDPFKSQVTVLSLQSNIAPAREPLGAILQRTLSNVIYSNTAPGLPEGKYAVLQYSSRFANRAAVAETVWLDFEDDHWLVIGYIIGPNNPRTMGLSSTGQASTAPDAKICSHDELVEARIARMNGYTSGPNCSNRP
jgi:hypothetical protein